jgi:hypothetical protein|tara:strand:+ start:1227 stop:1577 length:351 start_codon:yes stop_codon:yes gene_type:complete
MSDSQGRLNKLEQDLSAYSAYSRALSKEVDQVRESVESLTVEVRKGFAASAQSKLTNWPVVFSGTAVIVMFGSLVWNTLDREQARQEKRIDRVEQSVNETAYRTAEQIRREFNGKE